MDTILDRLHAARAGQPLAWRAGRVVSCGEFREQAVRFASALPADEGALLNLCEDRFRFLVAYAGAALRGWASLLPPSRAVDAVAEVAARHAGARACDDAWVDEVLSAAGVAGTDRTAAPSAATVAYTSGSTGAPQPNYKTWSSLALCTRTKATKLDALLAGPARPWIVATVPPQHMYGLEFSVLLPLLGFGAVHAGRPLLPADVAAALAEVPEPRILVSTPLHLRVLVESAVAMPPLALVISATAPLEAETARRVEAAWNCRVLEVFGSTETGAFACRETAREAAWQPFGGVRLEPDDDSTRVTAPWLAEPARLQDVVEVDDSGRFVAVGRSRDLVEVAGKRASLGDLTRRVLAVPGVREAVLVQPDRGGTGLCRVAAVVVAPGLESGEIVDRLRNAMDPVFLPRPLVVVAELPRNELGKISRAAVLAVLECGPGVAGSRGTLC